MSSGSEPSSGSIDWDGDLLGVIDRLEARFAEVEPEIMAFVDEPGRFDRLRHQARTLQRLGGEALPLFGVLVGVKDIFHVDGLPTACGSRLPPEELGGPQAESVQRLLEAGALILGKAESTEFAYFGPARTRNPHHLNHTPGGSSSGSAAAVCAGLCPVSLGTQTIGSVTRPAAYCGVVGYKPTYGRVPISGVFPLAPSYDHVGVLAESVQWAYRLAEVLCDNWSQRPNATDSPVFGVPTGPYLDRASTVARDHLEQVCARLEAAGRRVVHHPAMDDFDAIEARHRRVLAAEVAAVHRSWFQRYGERYHAKTRELIELGQTIPAEEVAAGRTARTQLRHGLHRAMDDAGIDLWLTPSAPGPAPAGLESTGDPVMNLPWSQSGLPTLGLPAGRAPKDAGGLPLGVQLAARWGMDEALLVWGRQLEPLL